MAGFQEWVAPVLWSIAAIFALVGFIQKIIQPGIKVIIDIKKTAADFQTSIVEINNKLNKMEEKIVELQGSDQISNEAQQASIRIQLVQAYRFHKPDESISIEDYETIDALHKSYKALGGNHFIDRLMEELKNKPIRPIDR